MSKIRLPPIGFWSYARQDDELSQGKLSGLRSLLMFELQQQYGRDPIHIFQDVSTIPHGASWEQEIRTALDKTSFFIAIVTPNFIQSDWCCQEVSVFLEREAELQRLYPDLPHRSRIFPVQFIDIEDVDPADPTVLEALQSLQWFDFRRFRHRSYESEPVREAISELALSMRDLLQVRVEDPATARERERLAQEAEMRARQEEEAQAALAREQEARKRREVAQVKAEAARKRAEEAAESARKRAEEAAEAARLQVEEANEAARLLAEEEAAAERARLEAEVAAQRLTSGNLATVERARAESEAAVQRARVESVAAERARVEKEAAAERARSESEALAARERALAEEAAAAAAAAQQDYGDGGYSAGPKPPWAIIGIAALVLIAGLIYVLWGSLGGSGASADGNKAEAAAGTAGGEEAQSWLYGRWGVEGDPNCADPVTISSRPNQLWVVYSGDERAETITSATAQAVVTDRRRYTRSGDAVSVSETAEGGQIPYTMTRCSQ